jgi:mono/diheme cytochrome c family protein
MTTFLKNIRVSIWGLSALAVVVAAMVVATFPMQAAADAGDLALSVARGGKLYDKWYKVLGVDAPADAHAAYPASGKKQKGKDNWRCKECHGWDNLGSKGAYASGSHFSGIVGIRGMANADAAKIIAVLKDNNHLFGDKLGPQDFTDLANFVSQGQVDMDAYIDRASKKPKGDATKGKVYFSTICVGCHGTDGKLPKEMKPMGKQMGNPWEVMHKILNGQPGEAMPALHALDRQIAVDIMAHMSTLPKK